MIEETAISDTVKKSHTVQSTYRCLATILKCILQSCLKTFKNPVCQYIRKGILKLTRMQRKKGSIETLLSKGKKQFTEYLNSLSIQFDESISEVSLQNAQSQIRSKLCCSYDQNQKYLWAQYKVQLQTSSNDKKAHKNIQEIERNRQQNLLQLKQKIDYIFEQKLILNQKRITKKQYKKTQQMKEKQLMQNKQINVVTNLESTPQAFPQVQPIYMLMEQLSLESQRRHEQNNHNLFSSLGENIEIELENPIQFCSFSDNQSQGKRQVWFQENNDQDLFDLFENWINMN